MHALYIFSVWLHILAAATWIGGMAFLVLVVVPWMRKGDRAKGAVFFRETGTRFRNVGWACFGIVLVTGTFNLAFRGVRFGDFLDPAWRSSSFGHTLLIKLGIFALVLLLSGIHDFAIGPRATRTIVRAPASPEAERLRRAASHMGRTTALLALALVALGVMLVRGVPW